MKTNLKHRKIIESNFYGTFLHSIYKTLDWILIFLYFLTSGNLSEWNFTCLQEHRIFQAF
jgi:hypothetical protein